MGAVLRRGLTVLGRFLPAIMQGALPELINDTNIARITDVLRFIDKELNSFWTIPGFSVARYRGELATLHDRIQAEGSFVSHAQRFLIEARKPGP
jgi:hypothetical protein